MKIVLATSNKGKIEEFKKLLPKYEVLTAKEMIGDFEVIEDKDTFKGNAVKKAQEISEMILEKSKNNSEGYKDLEDVIVISDDSGITVPILGDEPGIYSARYAGVNASDKDNNAKLISKIKEKKLNKTEAYYTACIAMVYKDETYTVHGWMHGFVIPKEIGEGGFGYDPMFIPKGYDKTLGELSYEVKKEFSHRSQALKLALMQLEVILS